MQGFLKQSAARSGPPPIGGCTIRSRPALIGTKVMQIRRAQGRRNPFVSGFDRFSRIGRLIAKQTLIESELPCGTGRRRPKI